MTDTTNVIPLPERESEMFTRWIEGDRVREIAAHFRCDSDVVMRAIDAHLVMIDDNFRRRLLTRELERLETLYSVFFKLGKSGDHQAAGLCVKVSERRARLLGLDAPIRMDMERVTGVDRQTSTERLSAVLDLLVKPPSAA